MRHARTEAREARYLHRGEAGDMPSASGLDATGRMGRIVGVSLAECLPSRMPTLDVYHNGEPRAKSQESDKA